MLDSEYGTQSRPVPGAREKGGSCWRQGTHYLVGMKIDLVP